MTTSCPGFHDRYGIWNNGFDCSSPRICCGTDTDRYCCIPSSVLFPSSPASSSLTSPSTPYQKFDDLDSYVIDKSNDFLSEKWFFVQLCTVGIFLSIILLISAIIYMCCVSIRCNKRQKNMSIVQLPLPTRSSFIMDSKRVASNRLSTISSASSDVKSRCTDVSMVINTPLNIYPTSNSRNSTASSSSYYVYPNDFEYLCK